MIGAMRERVVVQSMTETVSSEGEPVKTWADFVTLWASVDFVTGRELEAMAKVNTSVGYRVKVRYRTDLSETMRLSWRSELLNIHAILPESKKDYMTLLASKVE
jgi:SPP1 family predicted phage head-tail adaptor